MAKLIIEKVENLPEHLQILTGKDFNPLAQKDVIYIPGSVNMAGIAKIPYYICAVLGALAGIFFLYTGVSEIIKWNKYGEFRNEGVMITFIIFAFMFGLFLLCRSFLKKSERQQQKIKNGEIRFGCWITPTHLLNNDMNSGCKAVAKSDIERLEIYKSGRPPIDMVVVCLRNKQVIRIVSDWLMGYYKKVEQLKSLIESNLNSKKIMPNVIGDFINSLNLPGCGNTRFTRLVDFAEKYDREHDLNQKEKQELIACINQKIENWMPEERLAEEHWWVDLTANDHWEYGVNTALIKEFKGYFKDPYWVMPLARTAILEFEMADLIVQRNVDAFVNANSFMSLEILILHIMVSDYFIEKIMVSGKFQHLKKLILPSIRFDDPSLKINFEEWKMKNNIISL